MTNALMPATWPYDILPLRRGPYGSCDSNDFGVLTHDEKGKVVPTVFIINLFDIHGREDLANAQQVKYADMETLLSEWKVD